MSGTMPVHAPSRRASLSLGIRQRAPRQPLLMPRPRASRSLWDNRIGDAGASALAEALKVNTALVEL